MLGRGIDQILKHPGEARLYELHIRSAADYVRLAEKANGPIPRGAELAYVWGDAGDAVARLRPDCGIVNLETAVTDRGQAEPKGINYRMNPANAAGLAALGIDCCGLANNHVLDWGRDGLLHTIDSLRARGLVTCGAGRDAAEAARPAIVAVPVGRVLVFAWASEDSGVPRHWQATAEKPGVNFLTDFDEPQVAAIAAAVAAEKRPGDVAVASIHWGGNWGYDIPDRHIAFARALIDAAEIDVVHGHSSHHPRGYEIHRGKLILYGCGDLINDYEGIGGEDEYRGEITALYAADIDASAGDIRSLTVVPFMLRKFRLNRASAADSGWLCQTMNRLCRTPGVTLSVAPDGTLRLATGGKASA